MTAHRRASVLLLLAVSVLAAPRVAIADATAPGDPARGRAIFVGDRPLANGGPACIRCHQVRDSGMPQGGLRAPDLTHIGGLDEPLVMAALSRQRFMMMDASFATKPLTEEERRDVAAFFADVAARNAATDAGTRAFPLLAVVGAVGGSLGLIAVLRSWRRRRAAA